MNPALALVGLDLEHSLYRREPSPFGLVEVEGVDAREYLHRLCSQDVLGLADGEVRHAAFLSPKGKLLATFLGHGTLVHTVSFNQDGSLLGSGGRDGAVRIWRIE